MYHIYKSKERGTNMTDISIFVHMDCEDLPELIRFYRSIFYHNQYRMNEFGRRAYFRDFIANATVIIGKEYGYSNLYEKQFGQNYVVMLMNRKKKMTFQRMVITH